MKKIFTLLSVALLSTGAFAQYSLTPVQAEELPEVVASSAEIANQRYERSTSTHVLSQTADNIVTSNATANACQDSYNAYYRLFDLADHGITGTFTPTSIDGAAIIWPGGFGEVGVFNLNGTEDVHIPHTDYEDTGLYAFYGNEGARVWDWVNFEILDENTVPITSDKKFAVVVTHPVTNSAAAWAGSLWPLFTSGAETKSAYFGGPTVGCHGGTAGSSTRFSSFVEGGRSILLTITGDSEELGTVELGSSKLAVYPNPATTEVNITLEGAKIAQVDVADVTGRVVSSQAVKNGKVNVSNLSSGVYFLRVKDDKGVTRIQKFIKK